MRPLTLSLCSVLPVKTTDGLQHCQSEVHWLTVTCHTWMVGEFAFHKPRLCSKKQHLVHDLWFSCFMTLCLSRLTFYHFSAAAGTHSKYCTDLLHVLSHSILRVSGQCLSPAVWGNYQLCSLTTAAWQQPELGPHRCLPGLDIMHTFFWLTTRTHVQTPALAHTPQACKRCQRHTCSAHTRAPIPDSCCTHSFHLHKSNDFLSWFSHGCS